MRYPIYLHQADDGSFSGFVPDVVGCYFAGNSIDDAIVDAANALGAYFEYLSEQGKIPVEAKTVADHLDDEDCTGGIWAYVDIDLAKYEGRTTKLNITLPQFLLARIDDYVSSHREYHSRSGFFAELARRELSKHS
ncbi:type II toxin-antitoxin system HicB family antitoxin [Xenorhabdus sp. DI]|uniref:type II toxin-antitoxin system HicB family antitoxin n=1 Tax=Xenorhabdus doucetiae TaxID=351671 RepID=UPI0019913893|nr:MULTISPECIES: type II toxin-antitoxin system HicB family antitoxin [unclassified Xenorhabdus]MBD2785277.1 type II toxin-antitoxin system HicB family antitoxin [Xenorhabdus sp. 3]MBD2790125.1 type II toxin-antitoxin system HicB family antitoxin [Xenorhabdus sp. DI]MBD2797356.1 type II toxin-antitoxin system HicB family antitoxin [Xenorhabdus sp. 18]